MQDNPEPGEASTTAYREFLADIKSAQPITNARQLKAGGSPPRSPISSGRVATSRENIKVKIWAASLVQMWDECKRCFWRRYVLNERRPSDFGEVFDIADRAMRRRMANAGNGGWVDIGVGPGEVRVHSQGAWVESEPIAFDDIGVTIILGGNTMQSSRTKPLNTTYSTIKLPRVRKLNFSDTGGSSSAGTSKPHTHGQFKTAHLGLVVPARIGYLEGAAFR
jgi:hypothetical protein